MAKVRTILAYTYFENYPVRTLVLVRLKLSRLQYSCKIFDHYYKDTL